MRYCKSCGKNTQTESAFCHECRWHKKWPDEVLNSPELLRRRKRSHRLNLISLDRDVPEAVFLSDSKDAR